MRTSGTALLAAGFLALTAAMLIRDPTARDANIGAGILALAGIPIGTIGLVLLVISTSRRRSGRPPAGKNQRW